MLKIRTGNHSLSIEIDRYKNRKTYEECICKSCKEQEIEDLYHVVVKCNGYEEMRKQKLSFMIDTSIPYSIHRNEQNDKERIKTDSRSYAIRCSNNKE